MDMCVEFEAENRRELVGLVHPYMAKRDLQ